MDLLRDLGGSSTRRWIRATAVVGLVFALLACGGDDDDSGGGAAQTSIERSGGLPDACGILPASDINKVTGHAYDAGKLNETLSNDNQKICESQPKDKSGQTVSVMVNLSGNSFDDQRRMANDTLPTPVEDLTGIGDAAYWVTDTQSVAAKVGSTFLQVSLVSGSKEVVVELTKTALGHMK